MNHGDAAKSCMWWSWNLCVCESVIITPATDCTQATSMCPKSRSCLSMCVWFTHYGIFCGLKRNGDNCATLMMPLHALFWHVFAQKNPSRNLHSDSHIPAQVNIWFKGSERTSSHPVASSLSTFALVIPEKWLSTTTDMLFHTLWLLATVNYRYDPSKHECQNSWRPW